MKKLTIIVFFCIGISAFISSCSFVNVSPQSRLIDVESLDLLSFAITEDTTENIYIDTTLVTYGDTTLITNEDSTVVIYGDTSSVTYEDSTLITFRDTTIITENKKIGKIKIAEIDVSALPTKVINYININFSEPSIRQAATLEDGSFIVKITQKNENSIGLKFNSKGAFVSRKMSKSQSLPILISDIPAHIVSYIKSNYEGSSILYAIQTDRTYGVLVQKMDDTLVGVGFNSKGKFFAEIIPKSN